MSIYRKIKLLPDYLLGYGFGDPYKNGEYRFIRNLLQDNMVVFDVGANIGEYSKYLFSVNDNIIVHCFEPVKKTFEKLSENFSNWGLTSKVKINNVGLSDITGETEIYIYGDYAGSNSLYFNEYHSEKSTKVDKEIINLTTLDKYVENNKIKNIDFLKIDVEGNELKVIIGGINSLKSSLIKVIQFEYNDYWLKSNAHLEEIYSILIQHNFNIFKITPWGKIRIHNFNKKLENYKHSNYVAILND